MLDLLLHVILAVTLVRSIAEMLQIFKFPFIFEWIMVVLHWIIETFFENSIKDV